MADQPNLDELSQSFDRCRNIPAFDGGIAILQAIQAMGGKLNEYASAIVLKHY